MEMKINSLQNNNITSKGASVLFDVLKECSSVVSNLNISHNLMNDDCLRNLGEYVQNNEYLERLKIGGLDITDKGIEIFSEYMTGNVKMKYLFFGESYGITDASVPFFMEIARKSCIEKVSIWGTSISEEKIPEVFQEFRIPIDQREIPIKSNSKSAAKISSFSAST